MTDLILTNKDWEMVLDGLEALKSSKATTEMMGDLLEAAFLSPKKDATPEDRERWEKRKEEKEIEKRLKKEAESAQSRRIDVLKAKIVLMQDQEINSTNN